jgi:hypothetical protein
MTIAMAASCSVTGSFCLDQVQHRLLVAHRFAQVAVQHAGNPVGVAHRQRLVEVHLLLQVGDHLRVLVLARQDLDRHHRAAVAAARRCMTPAPAPACAMRLKERT